MLEKTKGILEYLVMLWHIKKFCPLVESVCKVRPIHSYSPPGDSVAVKKNSYASNVQNIVELMTPCLTLRILHKIHYIAEGLRQ